MARMTSLPRPLVAVGLALAMFLVVEVALQWRSYLRFGQSILTSVQGQSVYTRDPQTGLLLLTPNMESGGKLQVIRSNGVGLRSPEIPADKPPGTIRVAVLGASTVFGAYAPHNESTFPGRLERLLRDRMPDRRIEVINAGIPGFGLANQARLFDRLIAGFSPDITIVYPGFNDFGAYCRGTGTESTWRPQPLVSFELPGWLLSVELLLKNTVALRTMPEGLQARVDAAALDLGPYRERLRALLATLRRHGTQPFVARNTRSYRPEQPLAEQLALSETARFYNPCFDLPGLHLLYDRHNDAIAAEAGALGVPVLPLDEVIPGGRAHFVDASHFSERGEQAVAEWLADALAPHLQALADGAAK